MTLLQLIAHLKETFETHGEMEVEIRRSDDASTYLGVVTADDIEVDQEAKTITFI